GARGEVEHEGGAVAAQRNDTLDGGADFLLEIHQPHIVRQDDVGKLDEDESGSTAGLEDGKEVAVESARGESGEQAGAANLAARLDDDERAVFAGGLERP